jgi:hypothetical protein
MDADVVGGLFGGAAGVLVGHPLDGEFVDCCTWVMLVEDVG